MPRRMGKLQASFASATYPLKLDCRGTRDQGGVSESMRAAEEADSRLQARRQEIPFWPSFEHQSRDITRSLLKAIFAAVMLFALVLRRVILLPDRHNGVGSVD